jgi:hypothetical protein
VCVVGLRADPGARGGTFTLHLSHLADALIQSDLHDLRLKMSQVRDSQG